MSRGEALRRDPEAARELGRLAGRTRRFQAIEARIREVAEARPALTPAQKAHLAALLSSVPVDDGPTSGPSKRDRQRAARAAS